jgi:uncharacterized protein YneF (UPF0154 family)
MIDTLFIIVFYFSIIALCFGALIAVGCFISPKFKQEFLNDWNRK